MWICLVLFGHCSQTPDFQPLPSLQLLVPFHLPGHGAAGKTIKNWERQQDCVISQKLNWLYKQPELDFFSYWTFRWFPQINFFSRTKIQTIDFIDWLSHCFVNAFQNSVVSDWENEINYQQNLNKSNHPRLSATQGLVTVPFWEYWTSPYSSHYRPYT